MQEGLFQQYFGKQAFILLIFAPHPRTLSPLSSHSLTLVHIFFSPDPRSWNQEWRMRKSETITYM